MSRARSRFTFWPGAALLLLPAAVLIIVFFIVPFARMFQISFYEHASGTIMQPAFTFEQYVSFLTDPFYLGKLWLTIWMGFVVTVVALALGYPVAYFLARARIRGKGLLIGLILAPLLTNFIVLVFAWIVLLSKKGVVNGLLQQVGLPPVTFMHDVKGVQLALVHVALPFVILPLIGAIGNIDPGLEDAAMSLGAGRWRAFWTVVAPLSLPGIFAASLIAFSIVLSAFAFALYIGGDQVLIIPLLVYQAVTGTNNWPQAAALSFITFAVTLALLFLYLAALRAVRGRKTG
ncbi:MAG: ABC transporter permease [Thermomicrobiales bacterium]|nr:ABC transporter permease [Thermomicrobiales bacterium]